MMGGAKTLPAMMGVLLAFVAIYFIVMVGNMVVTKVKKSRKEKRNRENDL